MGDVLATDEPRFEAPGSPSLEGLNRAVYRRAEVVGEYAGSQTLQPGEAALLAGLGDVVRGRVLDLGVGGGRTVEPLAGPAASYVGVDYSAEMVAAARARHPGRRIEQADARDLSAFADASFDLVFFSFNGLDYVAHDDRLRVLAEVRRVLAPGGWFGFSTHNREHDRLGLMPWQRRRPTRAVLRRSLGTLPYLLRHRRMRRLEVDAPAYALVNDDAHHYALLTYYIALGDQVAQLEAAGFTDVRAYDLRGDRITDGHGPDVWLHYAARVMS